MSEISATKSSDVTASTTTARGDYLTPEERADFNQKRLDAIASVNPETTTYDLLKAVDTDSFSIKLSKHLEDYRRGEAYLSLDVAAELYQRSEKASSTFAQTDPKAAAAYNAYSTGFGYESRARFIQALSGTADTSATLLALSKKLNKIA